MPRVLVDHRSKLSGVLPGTLTALVREIARTLSRDAHLAKNAELSVSFVDDSEMRDLNRDYRKLDRTTDVLAFALSEGQPLHLPDAEEGAPLLLGDVVISLETAQRQALRMQHTLRREVATLLVHGILHIIGHDHTDTSATGKKQAREMRRLQDHYIQKMEAEGLL